MCLILVAFRVEPQYPLVVAANRDEYFARPTSAAHFWLDHPEIFAGRDLQELGTWMGVTSSGRFAAVANWSFNSENLSGYHSRGELVREFLLSKSDPLGFVHAIEHNKYRGCNLILFDGTSLVCWNNHENSIVELDYGCHAITNANFPSNSRRANSGQKKLEQLTTKHDANDLLAILGPREKSCPEDCFIVGDTYGTRSSTALLIGPTKIIVCEQQYGPNVEVGVRTHQEIVVPSR